VKILDAYRFDIDVFPIGVSTLVKDNMETALKRILTPKTSVDILRDIEQAKARSKAYSITFIGVNGVGKVLYDSTTLCNGFTFVEFH
jgi:signal recognition particle GTPase